MNYSKMLLMSLIVLFLSIGFCSANDMNDTELINSEPIGSFSELQDLINDASENSVINLDKDYAFMDSDKNYLMHVSPTFSKDAEN